MISLLKDCYIRYKLNLIVIEYVNSVLANYSFRSTLDFCRNVYIKAKWFKLLGTSFADIFY